MKKEQYAIQITIGIEFSFTLCLVTFSTLYALTCLLTLCDLCLGSINGFFENSDDLLGILSTENRRTSHDNVAPCICADTDSRGTDTTVDLDVFIRETCS